MQWEKWENEKKTQLYRHNSLQQRNLKVHVYAFARLLFGISLKLKLSGQKEALANACWTECYLLLCCICLQNISLAAFSVLCLSSINMFLCSRTVKSRALWLLNEFQSDAIEWYYLHFGACVVLLLDYGYHILSAVLPYVSPIREVS